ncbi:MAG: hypothetical protein ABEI52_10630, partial [Halobacteriaceae archaeon]
TREYERGEISRETYQQRVTSIRSQLNQIYTRGIRQLLSPAFREIRDGFETLEGQRQRLQQRIRNRSMPPLETQLDHLKSMNSSEVDLVLKRLLTDGGDTSIAL